MRPMALGELRDWQRKYNCSAWMLLGLAGLEFHIADLEVWRDFCGAMGQEDCDRFATAVQPPGCRPIPLKAFGPHGRLQVKVQGAS